MLLSRSNEHCTWHWLGPQLRRKHLAEVAAIAAQQVVGGPLPLLTYPNDDGVDLRASGLVHEYQQQGIQHPVVGSDATSRWLCQCARSR